MFKATRYLGASAIVAGLMVAAPACASGGYYTYQRDYRDVERRAYQNGFEVGVRQGEHDARDRRSFAYDRDRDYRDADRGYSRGWGDRDDYRRVFRRGFEAGYSEGFNRIARAYAPVYPSYPGVVAPRGSYVSRASDIGYRDGFEAGRNDARSRSAFDPIRARRYREGDHDYDNRYGSRDEYKRMYRDAFQRGYQQGYREYR